MFKEFMINKFILSLAIIIGGCLPVWCEITAVSPDKLNEMLSQNPAPTVVDVRGGYDFQKGHIPGAINVGYNTIGKTDLPKDNMIVLYCGNDKCPLSHLAAKTLEPLGYTKLLVLEGGITAWMAKGFAIETAAGLQQKTADIKIS